jgi:hypothetical protein
VTEYQVKAAFLTKFCLYIEWPPTAFTSADSPVVLGIAGPDDLAGLLEQLTKNQLVGGRQFQIRRIADGAALDGVHLLFVARAEESRLPQLAAQTRERPLLLVAESVSGLDDGAGINFIVQDAKIRFDVGLESTVQRGLKLSAPLLKVARNVRGAPR